MPIRLSSLPLILFCILSQHAWSASMLRISCDGDSARAEISINGQFKGECPMDVEVKAGEIRVRAVKNQNVEVERVFEDSFRLGDGVIKRIEIQLGKPQYTAEGMRRLQARKQAEEEAARRAAEEKERTIAAKFAALSAQGVEPGNGQAFRDCPECPELVLLPPGQFRMGSADNERNRDADEGPAHDVRIAHHLAVGRHEVARGEFEQFVKATGYRSDAEKGMGCRVWKTTWSGARIENVAEHNWRNPGFPQTDRHPAVCISWNDAQAYLKWLNGKIPGMGYRLLSEAEWEFAARAGQGNSRFPWGDDHDGSAQCLYANARDRVAQEQLPRSDLMGGIVANCGDDHVYTAPVDTLNPNVFGLHHMHGNASEWVEDTWHDNYKGAPVNGDAWLTGGNATARVVRGGSWISPQEFIRSARRTHSHPGFSYQYIGFRIARIL